MVYTIATLLNSAQGVRARRRETLLEPLAA
jgi:hypothetical protein